MDGPLNVKIVSRLNPQQCDGKIKVHNNMLRHNIRYVTTANSVFSQVRTESSLGA